MPMMPSGAVSSTMVTRDTLCSWIMRMVTTASTKVAGVVSGWVHTGRTNGTEYGYALQSVDTHGNTSAASIPLAAAGWWSRSSFQTFCGVIGMSMLRTPSFAILR